MHVTESILKTSTFKRSLQHSKASYILIYTLYIIVIYLVTTIPGALKTC